MYIPSPDCSIQSTGTQSYTVDHIMSILQSLYYIRFNHANSHNNLQEGD